MTKFVRGLLPAEQGTKIIGGKPYYFARVPVAPRDQELCLLPGRDPDEPGTCEKILKFGASHHVCVLEAPHPMEDHLTSFGLNWPNVEKSKVAEVDPRLAQLVDDMVAASEGELTRADVVARLERALLDPVVEPLQVNGP